MQRRRRPLSLRAVVPRTLPRRSACIRTRAGHPRGVPRGRRPLRAADPAQVVQPAVGPKPSQVAGAVHPLTVLVGDEPLRGQSSPAASSPPRTPRSHGPALSPGLRARQRTRGAGLRSDRHPVRAARRRIHREQPRRARQPAGTSEATLGPVGTDLVVGKESCDHRLAVELGVHVRRPPGR